MIDYTPKNDLIFKFMFGEQKHQKFLIHWLNTILSPETPIVSLQIQQSEISPEYIIGSSVRLDIQAETSNNELVDIEIQKCDKHNFKERAVYYASKVFSRQTVNKQSYQDLKKTIFIGVLNYSLFEDMRTWHKHYLTDDETHERLTDKLEFHFFELPKIRRRGGKDIGKNSSLWFWLKFIDNPEDEELLEMYRKENVFQAAKNAYERCIADPQTRELLRIQEEGEMDRKSEQETARQQGITEGLEKGAYTKAIETAKNFLSMGLSVEQISKGTGLSLEELAKL